MPERSQCPPTHRHLLMTSKLISLLIVLLLITLTKTLLIILALAALGLLLGCLIVRPRATLTALALIPVMSLASARPGLRIHDLRHSAASFMVNSGVDLFAVGKVLGHASYQSTQRYSHLANDTLLKAVEAGAAKHKAW